MHACERAVGAVARDLVATPEPELAPVRGHDLVGNEPHQRERAGGGVEAGLGERGEILLGAHVTRDRPHTGLGLGEPAVELPAHPFGQRRG